MSLKLNNLVAPRRIPALEKGKLKMKANPIMLLKTKTGNFSAGLIPSYL
jgi:hypothetical protein